MKRAVGAGLVLALGLAAAFAVAPGVLDRRFNRMTPRTARHPSARALDLHRRLTIVDLHADSLLWGRDLNARAERGHVDVPRLIEGNVAVEAFTVVTKTPRNINVHRNTDQSDNVTLLALALRWPPRTWGSLKERALYQAALLHRFAARSQGRLTVLRTADDLGRYLERRRSEPRITAAFLGLEGASALTDVSDLDALEGAGFRMIAPTHFFDTEWAGSAHGAAKGGLTDKGRALVRRMEGRGVLLDLAHASPRAIDDALAMARRPVVVSHTGVKGTCDNARNLSDAQLRGVAATGGLVGIGFWSGASDGAVCGTEPRDIARAIRHAVHVAGVEHVGLGSDWDGAVTVPFDAAGLVELTDALLAEGFTEREVALIMGGNALRVLSQGLS